MKLKLLGVGLFREGFKIKNSDVVIKFPLRAETTKEGIEHSRSEMRRLRRLRATGTLEPFLPEVLYYDKKNGVIAMRYYKNFESYEQQADAMGRMIEKMIYRIAHVRVTDIHTENVRRGRASRDVTLIDLGY